MFTLLLCGYVHIPHHIIRKSYCFAVMFRTSTTKQAYWHKVIGTYDEQLHVVLVASMTWQPLNNNVDIGLSVQTESGV